MTSNTLQISDRVLRLATAYKRALYEMMRGSVDASNRMTIRDVAVPIALGVQKPTKEQEEQLEVYHTRLEELAERRGKEKKQLIAMCLKFRE